MVQSKKPKEEITLTDDEPRLVKLMIDYFYQLDYNDRPQVTAMVTPPRITRNRAESPESPVEQKVEYYEGLIRTKDNAAEPAEEPPTAEDAVDGALVYSVPEPATIDELPPATDDGSFGSIKPAKKGKKKKKTSSLCDHFLPSEPAPESDPPTVSEAQGLLHFCSDKSDSEIDNTELSINALMYALADKYGIEDLKELARNKFADAASFERNWNSSSFPYAANLVCETTPDVDKGLRTVVIDTLNQHRELLGYEEIQQLLGSSNGLALSLLNCVLGEDRAAKLW